MDELKYLLKQNVAGDASSTYKAVSTTLKNNVAINSLITWIKTTSVSRCLSSEEVLNMAQTLKCRH